MAFDHYGEERFSPDVRFGDGTYVGVNCVISAAGTIDIGTDVTVGDNVYIGGAQHGYVALDAGVNQQPLTPGDIYIGDRAWIGFGAFLNARGSLVIGEHAIVSANSVVTKDVPPFTIVAGVPAVPIKAYDHVTGEWLRIGPVN